jgi:hypothetical protein
VRRAPSVDGLVGHVAVVGGSCAAAAAVILGAFRGVSGWALAFRAGTSFLVVHVVLNVLGYVTVRSILSGIVAREIERNDSAAPKRVR